MYPTQFIALAVAIVSDVLDYVGGFIPGLGDILDAVTIGALYFLLRNKFVLVGVVEFVPLVDFVPTYTLLVLADMWGYHF